MFSTQDFSSISCLLYLSFVCFFSAIFNLLKLSYQYKKFTIRTKNPNIPDILAADQGNVENKEQDTGDGRSFQRVREKVTD